MVMGSVGSKIATLKVEPSALKTYLTRPHGLIRIAVRPGAVVWLALYTEIHGDAALSLGEFHLAWSDLTCVVIALYRL